MARWTFEWCQLHISIFHIIVLTKYIILYLWHENQYHNTKILCHYIFKNIISKVEEYSSCLSVFFMSQIWFPSQEIQLFSKHLKHTGKISSNITRTSTYIFFLGFFFVELVFLFDCVSVRFCFFKILHWPMATRMTIWESPFRLSNHTHNLNQNNLKFM